MKEGRVGNEAKTKTTVRTRKDLKTSFEGNHISELVTPPGATPEKVWGGGGGGLLTHSNGSHKNVVC